MEILEITGNNLESDGIEIIGGSFLVREKCNLISFDVNSIYIYIILISL